MKKTIISLLGLSMLSLAQANEKTGELKSSATMEATCFISANQIGFGAVAIPLLAQTANSEMSVKCSNASAYTIDLSYGGVYGQGLSGYSMSSAGFSSEASYYFIYNSSGNNIGNLFCGYANGVSYLSYFNTPEVANVYGGTAGTWQNNKACTSNGALAGTHPAGWVGAFNAPGKQLVGGPTYTYGIMQGSAKGDKLAYSIAVPGDSSKVWNKGNNSYKSTGNGTLQTIPLVAKIVPDKSGSKYPAPDMYMDTVTAVISY